MKVFVRPRVRRLIVASALGLMLAVAHGSPAHALTCSSGRVVYIYSNISGATVNRGHFWPGASVTLSPPNGYRENNTGASRVDAYAIGTNGFITSAGMYCKTGPQ